MTSTPRSGDALVAELRAALIQGAMWFEEYARLHAKKMTPEGDDKSVVNSRRANVLRMAALKGTPRDPESARPPSSGAAVEPFVYAYRYHSPWKDGATCLRFNDGREVNGSKPIEAIPFYTAEQIAAARTAGFAEAKEKVVKVAEKMRFECAGTLAIVEALRAIEEGK